ncbi:MAG TPA: EpsI family protein [Bryobacteraceae bacterium]|nr:EpsI family protein [Bryobacteraceae bacterium]
MLALTLGVSKWSDSRPPDRLHQPLEKFPAKVGNWEMKSSSELTPGVLAKLIPTAYIDRQYTKAGSQIELFIAYYDSQRAGESMHSPRNCLPGAGWEIWDYSTGNVAVNGTSYPVNKFFVQNGQARGVVLYWYQTRDRVVADEYQAKAFFIWDKITKAHTGGSIVRITSTDRPGALDDEQEFARLAIPAMQEILGR